MGWMCTILAVVILVINITSSPKPFGKATIDDFTPVKDSIADAKIVKKVNISSKGSRNDYYELDVNTSSGQMFYLRRPDQPGELTRYLAVLPIGREVSIRYFNRLFNSHVILDVRNENQVFIPFDEIIADENHKRNVSFVLFGIFALLGAIGFWFGQRKQHALSEHIQTH